MTDTFNTPPISVVIPAFNGASCLRRAVESAYIACSQAAEVIVIDDGSTDSTPELCRELKAQFPELIVIRQSNGGVSAARNTGIRQATGAYIAFLDCDDELLSIDLAELISSSADMVRLGVEEISVNGLSSFKAPQELELPGPVYLKQALENDAFYVPSWAYVYRRGFIDSSCLRFIEGILHEDCLFTIEALLKAGRVCASSRSFYRYIRAENSITLKRNAKHYRKRTQSLSVIVKELTVLANTHGSVDLWIWICQMIEEAWRIAEQSTSRLCRIDAAAMELGLFVRYGLWGVRRTRLEEKWRVRRCILQVI